jgi:hypothetical protein
MKFLIHAQSPRRLAHQLRAAGFEAIHTLDLPQGNRSDLIRSETGAVYHCGTSAPLEERIKEQEHRLLADLKLR